jgi:hypothetical protein
MFGPVSCDLVAVSSFRPLRDCSPEILENQLRAKRSWEKVFDRIILFGSYEPLLASPKTEFIPGEEFPHISLMALVASWQEDPVCILNADIVVSEHLKAIVQRSMSIASALTSRRFEFDPQAPDLSSAKVVDVGIDFFCAVPAVWRQAHAEIPAAFRIGHQQWDTWTLGFLTSFCHGKFFDITPSRAVFHPRHGDRKMPHKVSVPEEAFYFAMGFPPLLYV